MQFLSDLLSLLILNGGQALGELLGLLFYRLPFSDIPKDAADTEGFAIVIELRMARRQDPPCLIVWLSDAEFEFLPSAVPFWADLIPATTIGRSFGWTARKKASGFEPEFDLRPNISRLCSVVQRWPVRISYCQRPVFVKAVVKVNRCSLSLSETSAFLRRVV